MRKLFYQLTLAISIVISVFVLGILGPIMITTILVSFTSVTYCQIIGHSEVFWVFTIIGWVISGVFINDMIKKQGII